MLRSSLRSRHPIVESGPGFLGRRRPRPGLLLGIVLAHLLVIAWLVTRPAEKSVSERGGTVLALSSFAPERPPSTPPRPPVVRPLVKPVLIVPVPPPAAEIAASQAASAAAGIPGQCTLAADTQAAILRDPAAMAELAGLPPGLRTEAGAVMVWNGAWNILAVPAVPATSAAGQAADALRTAIVGVVNAAAPACRDGPVSGPAFIIIPEGNRTTFLVIGSGVWHWADLLNADATCVVSPATNCPKATADRPTF